MTNYNVSDDPKMMRETLCVAQGALARMYPDVSPEQKRHIDRLQRLIDECDRHRPLGPDGKHGNRHTATCGCEDKPGYPHGCDWHEEGGYGYVWGCRSCNDVPDCLTVPSVHSNPHRGCPDTAR